MKSISFVLSIMIALWFATAVGIAGASDAGVGVCVLGNGATFTTPEAQNTFVGVNVGQNSETGVYGDQVAYETQCCAETGQEPDCFEPVQ